MNILSQTLFCALVLTPIEVTCQKSVHIPVLEEGVTGYTDA